MVKPKIDEIVLRTTILTKDEVFDASISQIKIELSSGHSVI